MAAHCAFAVAEWNSGQMEPWLSKRFERTYFNGQFYGETEKFVNENINDFSLIVSETKPPKKVQGVLLTNKNWVSNLVVNATADAVQLEKLAPFIEGVVSGKEAALLQDEHAAPVGTGFRLLKASCAFCLSKDSY